MQHIEANGWRLEIRDGVGSASRGGVEHILLPLAPMVDGQPLTIDSWESAGPNHLVGKLNRGGSVHLAVDCGHVCYWMETDTAEFNTLSYFPELTFDGKYWQTYMSDEHDRKWDVSIDQEVGLSSAYDDLMNPFGADGAGMTDPGDFPPYLSWNMPVRAFSVQTNTGWVGFSMPGALPVGVIRLSMERLKLTVNFDVLRPGCREGSMPRVYIVTGLSDPYDLLDEHRIISTNLGLTVPKKGDHPSWWTNPEFYYWDEFSRLERQTPDAASRKEIITKDNLIIWLNTVKENIGIQNMNMPMEQGCYQYYGDYRPTEKMGGIAGFREIVDRLREEWTHVGYYIHPYTVNTKVAFWKEHPEAFCRPKDPNHKFFYALEYDTETPEFQLLDWTHPAAREYMEEQIRMIMSDEPGCLNCDILRSNHWRSPDPRVYDFHDPDWGIGDLMTYKVQKHIYETAKRIKPDCMVSKIGIADPYMQPVADVCFLCEEWNGYTDNWYKRGRIATRTIPDLIFYTDSWFVTVTKGYEYYMGMLAWNLPSTESVHHTIHPYMFWRELQEKDYKRRKAGFHAAINAPIWRGDLCRVNILECGEVEQWRKRTEGNLAGFYAAIGIGRKTLVTFSETEARIATSITRTVEFPLPPGARVEKVELTPHDGASEPCDYELVMTNEGPGIRMHVEDCGKRAFFHSIRYKIGEE